MLLLFESKHNKDHFLCLPYVHNYPARQNMLLNDILFPEKKCALEFVLFSFQLYPRIIFNFNNYIPRVNQII